MGMSCTICRHPQKDDIDTALMGTDTIRNISALYDVSTGALQRHKKDHLIDKLAEVQKAREDALKGFREKVAVNAQTDLSRADDLLSQVHDLRQKAVSLLNQAEESGDLRTALAGIKEARGCIELLARIDGQLDERTQVNITLSTEWVELRTLIINALEPYPEAKQAVTNALH